MNTRQYYYLSTIANYGNLSHAAQALHISPSALSKFLAECERTFWLCFVPAVQPPPVPHRRGTVCGGMRPEDP